MDETAIFESLKKLRLLSVLPDDLIQQLYSRMTQETLAKGDTLFRKGDPAGVLYLILEGDIAILLPHDDGSEEVLNNLGAGEAMGQMSLMDKGIRTATAVAISDAQLLRLNYEDFQKIIHNQPPKVLIALSDAATNQRLGYMDVLKQLPLFDSVPHELLGNLGSKLSIERLDEGETLFHKGDPGDSLYIVDGGWLKITTQDASGEELMLNKCGPGEVIGEMSLIDHEPRSANVIATAPARLLKLHREDFLDVISAQPSIAMEIMRNISGRLRFATTYIEQAIEWSKRVAEGDYSFAMDQIKSSQTGMERDAAADAAKASELLSAFFQMVRDVQQREETLKEQVRVLTIQIDEAKRQQEVKSLTDSDSFAALKAQAARLRAERDEE
jgi:CRP-like cAMP-binding protein